MKRVLLSTFVLSLCTVSAMAQELIKEWNWNAENLKKVKGIKFNSGRNIFTRIISSETKTPDGENTLELTIKTAPNKASHSKAVMFVIPEIEIKTGDKFKITFFCKGSLPGAIGLSAMQGAKPWKRLGQKSVKGFRINEEWQEIVLTFVASVNYMGKAYMPMLMIGKYPLAGKINIGPLKFYKMIKHIPLKLNTTWSIFPGISPKGVKLNTFKKIPLLLTAAGGGSIDARNAVLNDNSLNLTKLNGGKFSANKSFAILFNEFESEADGYMQVGMAADWWFECCVNGKKVYDTLSTGNIMKPFGTSNHVFNFPVRKGKNLLAVKVRSGGGGWLFFCGAVPFKEETDFIERIVAGDKWKAVNMRKQKWFNGRNGCPRPFRFDKLMVKPGTALDLSRLIDPGPAGRYGRVIINSKGHLAFEKQAEKAVRFRSIAFVSCVWNYFFKLSKKEIEEFAEAIRLRGYNMVRAHNVSSWLIKGKSGYIRSKKKFSEVKIPQTRAELPIDKAIADRFDYFIACLKKRGIYIYLDAMTSNCGWSIARKGTDNSFFKKQLYFKESCKNNWKAGTEYLLQHVNPYTGTKLADDPVLACLLLYNEQDIQLRFLPAFTPHWRQYLKKKYVSIEKLRTAWQNRFGPKALGAVKSFNTISPINGALLSTNSAAGRDAVDFLEKIMAEMTDWYYKQVLAMGYNGLVTQWDMYMRLLDTPPRAKMPVVSMHTYHAHSSKHPLSVKGYKQQLLFASWMKNKEIRVHTSSSLVNAGAYFRRAALTRILDRPFMIMEYSHSAHNPYAHERGLFFGAYAALQGWDALASFNSVVRLYHTPLSGYGFNSSVDPETLASETISAFAWLRGDVKTASHSVEYTITPEMVRSSHSIQALGTDYGKVFMLTRIGNSYPVKPLAAVGDNKPDLKIIPESFAMVNGGDPMFVVVADDIKDGKIIGNIVNKLRVKNILGKNNITNAAKGIFQSETGELTLNTKKLTMTVISPRLEGAIIKADHPIKLDCLTINSCSLPACIAAISLDRGKSLKKTKHILLIFTTRGAANQATFANNGTSLIDEGVFPSMMRTGKLSISLQNDSAAAPVVYALNLDGTRAENVSCEYKDGKLLLKLDTNKLKYATPYFEIVF